MNLNRLTPLFICSTLFASASVFAADAVVEPAPTASTSEPAPTHEKMKNHMPHKTQTKSANGKPTVDTKTLSTVEKTPGAGGSTKGGETSGQ